MGSVSLTNESAFEAGWHSYSLQCAKSKLFVFQKAHYSDVIMDSIASQITSLTTVYSGVYSDEDQRKHQSSAPLAFVRGIHRGPVNSPHKCPVTQKLFPFDDVIMCSPLWKTRQSVVGLILPLKSFS